MILRYQKFSHRKEEELKLTGNEIQNMPHCLEIPRTPSEQKLNSKRSNTGK